MIPPYVNWVGAYGAGSGGSTGAADRTYIVYGPTHISQPLTTTIIAFFVRTAPLTGIKIGAFTPGTLSSFTCHAVVSLPDVTVTGWHTANVALSFNAGDDIGCYYTGGSMDFGGTLPFEYLESGDHCNVGDNTTYTFTGAGPNLWADNYVIPYETDAATAITKTTATLNGTLLNPWALSQIYQFQYGLTTSYGSTTPYYTCSSVPLAVSANLTGLTPNTTYHYRLMGGEGYGPDMTFTTSPDVNVFEFVESSLEINSVIGQTVSTLRGTIHDPTRSLTITEDTDIAEYDISNGELIFAGLISYVDDYSTGLERYFDLICQDYSILLDRSIVYVAYPAAFTYTVGSTTYTGDLAILMDVFANRVLQPLGSAIGQWGPSEITVDPTLCQMGTSGLSSMNFFYWTLREVLDYLTGLVNFDYYVDYQKKLHYYFTPNNTAPYGLSNAPDGVTTLPYHSMKRHRDGTRVVNNFMVIGTQVSGLDTQVNYGISGGDSSPAVFCINPKGENVLTLNPPSSSSTGLIRVFTNTGTDGSPTWTELTNGGIYGFNEPSINVPPVSHDWLFDPNTNNLYFETPPPDNPTNSFAVQYAIGLNGGTPDSVPGSITKYGRAFSGRLVANDTNTAASIMGNLQRLKSQFGYALQIIYCSIDSKDFPGTTRFEKGQYLHFHDALLTIDGYYWIHAITVKVAGGTVVSYDLELRSYSLE